jgi:outer membrane protein TolC
VRLALEANPDFQSQRAALEAVRADLVGARSVRYPSLGLSASAARYQTGESGALDRHDVGVSLRQTLYRGGRTQAGVDAAAAAVAIGDASLEAARADLVLAVRQTWYRVAQGVRLVRSSEEGLARSRLNLEYAEAQLQAGLGTRPDVLRARVDVSAADLELTRSRNALQGARALLNSLMGQPPARPLELAEDEAETSLPPLPSWAELRDSALDSREEMRAALARTARQEAVVRLARGAFLPTVSADAGASRGATASRSPQESWSLGLALSLPLFEGFALSADLQAQRALLQSARFDEQAVAQGIEREVWDALLAEEESALRLLNAQALFEAARENLEAAQESYRQGLSTMIALVDARTAFTGAEQTLIQAVFDRLIARAVLERVVEGDTLGRSPS